jgi:hypothetical protein
LVCPWDKELLKECRGGSLGNLELLFLLEFTLGLLGLVQRTLELKNLLPLLKKHTAVAVWVAARRRNASGVGYHF